jgi:hypothetical protein
MYSKSKTEFQNLKKKRMGTPDETQRIVGEASRICAVVTGSRCITHL